MVVFRLKGENELTEKLLKKINSSGKLHCVPASLKGQYVIRYFWRGVRVGYFLGGLTGGATTKGIAVTGFRGLIWVVVWVLWLGVFGLGKVFGCSGTDFYN
ncbi:UNVERIFIED_CONTAM: hypothetical protein GTU68_017385 [Idotea baltica]|nr:hypothetical protein [Idotea baltica]